MLCKVLRAAIAAPRFEDPVPLMGIHVERACGACGRHMNETVSWMSHVGHSLHGFLKVAWGQWQVGEVVLHGTWNPPQAHGGLNGAGGCGLAGLGTEGRIRWSCP